MTILITMSNSDKNNENLNQSVSNSNSNDQLPPPGYVRSPITLPVSTATPNIKQYGIRPHIIVKGG